jgi:hypothetical protein
MEEIRRRLVPLPLGIDLAVLLWGYGLILVFGVSYRAGADDKLLRMVKTMLHELVKLRGTTIKGHLSMVPIDAKAQPIILACIDMNLQVEPRYSPLTKTFNTFLFRLS